MHTYVGYGKRDVHATTINIEDNIYTHAAKDLTIRKIRTSVYIQNVHQLHEPSDASHIIYNIPPRALIICAIIQRWGPQLTILCIGRATTSIVPLRIVNRQHTNRNRSATTKLAIKIGHND